MITRTRTRTNRSINSTSISKFTQQRVLILLFVVNFFLWQSIGASMLLLGLPFFSPDDIPRGVIAMLWGHVHFLYPPDAYWLPLHSYLYGSWYSLVLPLNQVYWYVPLSSFVMAVGATGIGACALELIRAHQGRIGRAAAGCALLAPLMIRDNWRLAASALSEPLYLALLSWGMALMLRQIRIQATQFRTAGTMLLLLCLFQTTRYEAFPLSFLVWTLACWLGKPRGVSEARAAGIFGAGCAALAIFPIAWMAVNQHVRGDPFHFLQHFRDANPVVTGDSEEPFWNRMLRLRTWIFDQGWTLFALGAAGAWLTRRSRIGVALLILMIIALAQLVQVVMGNMSRLVTPSRFALGFAWVCAPFAPLALDSLWRAPGRGRAAALCLIGVILVYDVQPWVERRFCGMPMENEPITDYESISRLTRDCGYTLVVEDYDWYPLMNPLRFYAQPGAVTLYEHYPEGAPVKGKFLLFEKDAKDEAEPPDRLARRVGMYADRHVSFHWQMPPQNGQPEGKVE